ncbi:hypothetical protein DRO97_09660, partial [Archaeoglobales archaeon]
MRYATKLTLILLILILIVGCSEKNDVVSTYTPQHQRGAQNVVTPTPTTTTATTLTQTPISVPPIVSYCEKLGLSEEITEKIREKLGDGLDENKKEIINVIAEVEKNDYIPAGIKDLVPPNYGERKKGEIVGRIIDGVMNDGKLDNEKKDAIKYLFSLPANIQKEYLEKYGFNPDLVNYLNFVNQIKDEQFKKYVAEIQLGFADGKLDEKEKEFLESGDK